MLLRLKGAHFNFTLIRLHNKSSPLFIRLYGTKCRLSKVIVHFTKYFRLLVGPGGTREAMFFCRSATRPFLLICWVVIYRSLALLLKPSWSWLERVFVGCRWHNSHALPSAQDTDTRLEDSGERQSHANTLDILGKLQVSSWSIR